MNETTIDRKFKFVAVNPINGNVYTEENALILCAKDAATPAALRAYYNECLTIGANEDHLKSITLLMVRVDRFQQEHGARVPDTIGKELERCIEGKL